MTSEDYRELVEARENEHDAHVAVQRDKLSQRLHDAIAATGDCLYFVRHLSSDQVYDVEFAEGVGAELRLLEQAQAALAGAQALVERIVDA